MTGNTETEGRFLLLGLAIFLALFVAGVITCITNAPLRDVPAVEDLR